MSTRRLHRFSTAVLMVLLLIAIAVAPLSAQELPRNETLYIAGLQWGPPSTFNPLNPNPTWPGMAAHHHLYEALFAFNLLTGGLDSLLANDLTYLDDTTMQVTLHDGTRWQDGTELTVDDVIFSFEVGQRNDVPYSTFWNYVTEVSATGDRTIEISLNPERLNPGIVEGFLTTVNIIPEHVWAEREEAEEAIGQYVEMAPMGSGPYQLHSHSPERVAVERFDDYWGAEVFGLPAPRYIVHPIFESNDAGNLAFQRGEVDVSQQFAPQIWQMWENLNLPVGTWYDDEPYYVPGNVPLLHINVHKEGLDNPLVRRALAYSIDYPQIAAVAMSRYSAPAQPSLILPTGGESRFFNQELVDEYGWEYNPDRAREILEDELGATMGNDGIYVLPDGTRLGPYTAMAVFGWTDWMTAIELAAQSATEAGIEVRTEYPEQPVLYARRDAGDFDLIIFTHPGASPAQPWQRFRDVLDIRGVADFGSTAFWNWNRFEHPEAADLLDQAAAATDDAVRQELFDQLTMIYMENIPVIPLMYRPLEFYEFHETVWTGFPTSENPTAPPQFTQAGIQVLYVIEAIE
jgi:peptide/nickel transport system substrate-binding protein